MRDPSPDKAPLVDTTVRASLDNLAERTERVFDILKCPPTLALSAEEVGAMVELAAARFENLRDDARNLLKELGSDDAASSSSVQPEIWQIALELNWRASAILREVVAGIEEVASDETRLPHFARTAGILRSELLDLYPVHGVRDLSKIPRSLFARIEGCGDKTLREIEAAFQRRGVSLSPDN